MLASANMLNNLFVTRTLIKILFTQKGRTIRENLKSFFFKKKNNAKDSLLKIFVLLIQLLVFLLSLFLVMYKTYLKYSL